MMKKFRILICLTALLFSFQTDISMIASAGEFQAGETECAIEILAGDVTVDDNVDILDVVTLNRAILGKEKLSDIQNLAADVNYDGSIDASDSLVIMKMIVGLV